MSRTKPFNESAGQWFAVLAGWTPRRDEPPASRSACIAAALATAHFSRAAALPAAVFPVGHNASGSLLTSCWSRRDPYDPCQPTGASARRLAAERQGEVRR